MLIDFKKCGYQILDAFDRYNPCPSEEVKKSQAVYGGSWANIKLPSISFVDRSLNLGSRRKEVHVHVSADTKETPEQREARERREAEEHRNRLVMIVSGIGSVVGAYLVGKQYQEYSHFDERSEGLRTFVQNHRIYSNGNQNSEEQTTRDIGEVFLKYRNVYNEKLTKMKIYFVLKTALFIELTALCISAFYKKIPLRDGVGVAFFITGAVTALYYGMTHNSESKWKRQISNLASKVEHIKYNILKTIATPPSYAEAAEQLERQRFEAAGYSVPRKDDQGIVWIQHQESRVWLHFSSYHNVWISAPYHVPQLINLV